ncbi:hypothetical protein [Microcoleus sp. FACHB-672]|uniref:hypothetical protein n=1 Tax=Microcoleus sp. FACHB-672 TaxID=2692825 RepID=UPI0016825B84|nr:hypothetical protein [Microcoleus sp. FACHB-672]MBD2041169.1 hypothetical protein [Microcoleus sp. FACHB-672]
MCISNHHPGFIFSFTVEINRFHQGKLEKSERQSPCRHTLFLQAGDLALLWTSEENAPTQSQRTLKTMPAAMSLIDNILEPVLITLTR